MPPPRYARAAEGRILSGPAKDADLPPPPPRRHRLRLRQSPVERRGHRESATIDDECD
jgi:hypothetical protein